MGLVTMSYFIRSQQNLRNDKIVPYICSVGIPYRRCRDWNGPFRVMVPNNEPGSFFHLVGLYFPLLSARVLETTAVSKAKER